MDKYIKRLQTRASRKGISVSKSQVREVYTQVVVQPDSPTDEEIVFVIEELEKQYLAPSHEATGNSITDSTLTVVDQPEQPTLTQPEESQEMTQSNVESTPAQPAQEAPSNALATSNRSSQSQGSSLSTTLSQQQIQEAVEQQFGKENLETKTAILNYVAQDTFSTAQELQQALGKLRQMKLDILMKIIADHNQQATGDESLLKSALMNATASRKEESEVFFAGFENQLVQMRASFGI